MASPRRHRLRGYPGPSPEGAEAECPRLIPIPADDEEFCAAVEEASTGMTAEQLDRGVLEDILRPSFPRIRVTRREGLADPEAGRRACYVYRDGTWTRSGMSGDADPERRAKRRTLGAALAAWRTAEWRLAQAPVGSPRHEHAVAEAVRLREAFQSAMGAAGGPTGSSAGGGARLAANRVAADAAFAEETQRAADQSE